MTSKIPRTSLPAASGVEYVALVNFDAHHWPVGALSASVVSMSPDSWPLRSQVCVPSDPVVPAVLTVALVATRKFALMPGGERQLVRGDVAVVVRRARAGAASVDAAARGGVDLRAIAAAVDRVRSARAIGLAEVRRAIAVVHARLSAIGASATGDRERDAALQREDQRARGGHRGHATTVAKACQP